MLCLLIITINTIHYYKSSNRHSCLTVCNSACSVSLMQGIKGKKVTRVSNRGMMTRTSENVLTSENAYGYYQRETSG